MLSFNAPKNFKRGKYILGRYRIKDLILIIGLLFISVLSVIVYLNVFSSQNILLNVAVVFVLMIPALIAFVLFIPMPVYFNIFDYISSFFYYQSKQKKWKWEGVHLYEDYEEKDKIK